MKRIYAIQLKNKNFLYGDVNNTYPQLYKSVKDAQADLEWIDLDQEPKIVKVEVKVNGT